MLKVKVKIGVSSVHGTGLFADQFIPKETITWCYEQNLDKNITKEEMEALPELSRQFFLYYTYFDEKRGHYVLPIDHLRFINHSSIKEKLNIASTPDEDVASRDIQIGEELLCDYNKFDDTYFERIGLKDKEIN